MILIVVNELYVVLFIKKNLREVLVKLFEYLKVLYIYYVNFLV